MPPFWVRRLYKKLIQCDPVEHVELHRDRLRVLYKTGFVRVYTYVETKRYLYESSIGKEQCEISYPISIQFEHTWTKKNKEEMQKHFFVSREALDQCSFMDKELIVHDLFMRVLKSGYIKRIITNEMVDEEIDRLDQIRNVFYNGVFDLYANCGMSAGAKFPAQDIVEKYYDLSDVSHTGDINRTLRKALETPKIIYVALNKLMKSRLDISMSSLYRTIYRMGYGPRWRNPALYRLFLNQIFTIKPGMVIADRYPHYGEKAIACALLEADYMPLKGKIPTGLSKRLGINVLPIGKNADILIWDNNFKQVDIEQAFKFRKLAKHMVLYVQNEQARHAKKIAKPDRIVKIKTQPVRIKTPLDYLFVYH